MHGKLTAGTVAPIDPGSLSFAGFGLNRPECVLCLPNGTLATADWRGGVALTRPDGSERLILADRPVAGEPLKPNGIALQRDGSFLIAHLSETVGGVFRLDRDGTLTPVLTEIDGAPLPPTNFVMVDRRDRIWVTVSTRVVPRHSTRRPGHADGFIVLIDNGAARIVADGLAFANEVRFDAGETHLYAVETFGRRILRFPVAENGDLGGRSVFTEFGAGTFPDGIAFDEMGGLWATGIFSNRILYIDPAGQWQIVIEDQDHAEIERIESAFLDGSLAADPAFRLPARTLGSSASIAFGGPGRRMAFIGTLLNDRLPFFRAPVPGLALPHWFY